MAALVTDMLCNFYAMKNYKIANNWASTEAKEKIHADLESLEFYTFYDNHVLLDSNRIYYWISNCTTCHHYTNIIKKV